MKIVLALVIASATPSFAAPVLNSIDFPFAFFPRELWERELVWVKNVGLKNVALQARDTREADDLIFLLRAAQKLQLTAWVRLEPAAASLAPSLQPFLQAHGGPIAYLGAQVPQPVTRISALAPNALALGQAALLQARGTLLWTDVEDTLQPDFHRGAISFLGEEGPSVAALRRIALLFDYWQGGMDGLAPPREVRAPSGVALPPGIAARESLPLKGFASAAVAISNSTKTAFHGDLRVVYPAAARNLSIPAVEVPPGESLWLPVNVPLAPGPFCKNCSAFGNEDKIVYATAELIAVEYENGILAMEFAAPASGEVVLHLAKEPSGPLLAAGKPRPFDWDAGTGRARLPVPAGSGAASRVRIGLALEPPESSAFFEDAKMLIIGRKNVVPTTYSSPDIAGRSRLRAPPNLKCEPVVKGPLQIDYEIFVPADALHGDHVELALEADGTQMGHARLQLLRPASLRIREAVSRHFGTTADLPVSPVLIAMDQRAGRNLSVTIRNNFPAIQNYVLELSGAGVEFSPARIEVTVAGSSERDISVRAFPKAGAGGLLEARAVLSGAADFQLPLLLAVIPRGESIAYSVGGSYFLESARVRAVFADATARKWLELTWKDSERNVLPDSGIDFGAGERKVELKDAELVVEQSADLPPERLKAGKRGDLTLQVQRPLPTRAVYTLSR